LTFEAPDETLFPALTMARDALNAGGGAPAAMNAANEIGVAAFLDRRIGFLDIAALVADTLDALNGAGDLAADAAADPLDWAVAIDANARRVAAQVLSRFPGKG
jgi:1-deoxy-D-xylulose-5-phosphate reductoisomerase